MKPTHTQVLDKQLELDWQRVVSKQSVRSLAVEVVRMEQERLEHYDLEEAEQLSDPSQLEQRRLNPLAPRVELQKVNQSMCNLVLD